MGIRVPSTGTPWISFVLYSPIFSLSLSFLVLSWLRTLSFVLVTLAPSWDHSLLTVFMREGEQKTRLVPPYFRWGNVLSRSLCSCYTPWRKILRLALRSVCVEGSDFVVLVGFVVRETGWKTRRMRTPQLRHLPIIIITIIVTRRRRRTKNKKNKMKKKLSATFSSLQFLFSDPTKPGLPNIGESRQLWAIFQFPFFWAIRQ